MQLNMRCRLFADSDDGNDGIYLNSYEAIRKKLDTGIHVSYTYQGKDVW